MIDKSIFNLEGKNQEQVKEAYEALHVTEVDWA